MQAPACTMELAISLNLAALPPSARGCVHRPYSQCSAWLPDNVAPSENEYLVWVRGAGSKHDGQCDCTPAHLRLHLPHASSSPRQRLHERAQHHYPAGPLHVARSCTRPTSQGQGRGAAGSPSPGRTSQGPATICHHPLPLPRSPHSPPTGLPALYPALRLSPTTPASAAPLPLPGLPPAPSSPPIPTHHPEYTSSTSSTGWRHSGHATAAGGCCSPMLRRRACALSSAAAQA